MWDRAVIELLSPERRAVLKAVIARYQRQRREAGPELAATDLAAQMEKHQITADELRTAAWFFSK